MRFKSRSRALVGAASAGLLALAGLTTVAPSVGAAAPDRVAGVDRWETAVEAAKEGFCNPNASGVCTTDVDNVVIANGLNFPDALAAASLGQPILLVASDSIPQATMDGLAALDVGGDGITFDVVGGTAAVSSGVVGDLVDAGYDFGTRYAGTTRFGTALAIGQASIGGSTVFLANALTFPDSLAAGPGAYDSSVPILLTAPDALTDGIADFLLDNDISNVVILGGTAAISQDVEDELDLYNVTRLGGTDRYETARLVADALSVATDGIGVGGTDVFDLDPSPVAIATGQKFPDALTGGPFIGEMGGVLLLSPSASLGEDAEDFLMDEDPTQVYLLGGTAALSAQVAADVDAATTAGAQTGIVWDATAGSVDADNAAGTNIGPIDSATYASWSVDGSSVTKAAFDAAVSLGDSITINGTALELTSGSATAGLVGNVDTSAGTFDVITAGGNVLSNHDLAGATAFSVDGTSSNSTGFLAAVSLGDTVAVTDGADAGTVADDAFALTNDTLSGLTNGKGTFGAPDSFQIAALGDIPESAVDTYFSPDGTKQGFSVDGVPVTVEVFNAQNGDGDTVTYGRSADLETFALTNAATPPASATSNSFEGRTTDDTTIDTVVEVFADGGVFTVGDTLSGADVESDDGDAFVVTLNGTVTTMATAEAAMAGDDVAPFGHIVEYTDGDTTDTLAITAVTTTPELKLMVEAVIDNNTADDTFDAVIYGFAVGDNLSTATEYNSAATPTITYHVNGSAVTYTVFEDYLVDINDDGATEGFGDRIQIVVTSTGTEYHLTTNNTL